ncbi:tricarballylate/proton symporter TcuC [Cronobacter malonaticus]
METSMHSATSPVNTRSRIGAILRVTSGNFLEQFDFFLFGFYATYIAHTFFPASSEFASLMMTFAVFGAGFLMRPIGAIVLGAYIDKVGRRKGLIMTLSIMAAGTFLIVLIPSYEAIGLWAPLFVLIGRLLQGFSAGAELGGVSVYLAEIARPGRKGFYTSWQSGSQQVAIMVAAAMGFALNAVLDQSAISSWGWRLPFLFGCLIVPFIFVLRRKLEETQEFSARRHHLDMKQVFRMLLTHWPVVIAGMMMVAMTTTAFYLITVYAPTFGKKVLMLSASDSLLVTLLAARSIAYSDSASGRYVSTALFKKLGIEAQVETRARMVERIPVASEVAKGKYAVGFQQVSELLPEPDVTFVGELPDSVQYITRFAGAVTNNAAHAAEGRALLAFLASPDAQKVIHATGMRSVVQKAPVRLADTVQ